MGCLNKEPFSIKKFLFGNINRRLTILFLLVGIIAPSIAIYYFYSISTSLLIQDPELYAEQSRLLETTAILIIAMIAIDAGIIGFFISRSISKPLKELYKATQELEKGNFEVRTDIKTNDEIEQLSHAFNKSALALSRMDEERKQLDKAKSEFLSMTSHELRTPITPLKAQLQMLQNEFFGKLTEKQKESLEVVLRNAERLNSIGRRFFRNIKNRSGQAKICF